jgi:hypothetical protein
MMSRCVPIGERLEGAGESTILEAQPGAPGAHVELIVERVWLAEAKRFLFAVKALVHHQSSAGVTILRQRESDHRPRPASPRERSIRDVLILGQRRDVRIAHAEKVLAGNGVIGDDEAGLAIDQCDWSAETALP